MMVGMTRLAGWVLGAALFGAGAPASAQTSQMFRSAEVVAGRPARLGVVSNLTRDCKLGPLAEVRVVTPPKNGTLEVRDAKQKTPEKARCPNLETSVKAIFYQAPARYRGDDQVVFEIKNADGQLRSVTVKITVAERPKDGAKAEGQDL